MTRLRQSPLTVAAFAVLALAAVGAGWCGWSRSQTAAKTERRRNQLRAEWAAMRTLTPAPTADSTARLEAELTEAQATLARMRAALAGHGGAKETGEGAGAGAATTRTEAYFEVASFVERLRERARRNGVRLRADEYFGFATHAHEGPDPDILPTVRRQHEMAEFVLGALMDNRVQQIVSVQRERPKPVGASDTNAADGTTGRGTSASAGSGERGVAADFFDVDARGSARVPGFVDTLAMRVVFVGETDVLRALLNKLAAFERPIVVRAVEAEPAETTTAAPVAGASVPLVARRATRFTVTVEYVELAAERKA